MGGLPVLAIGESFIGKGSEAAPEVYQPPDPQ